MKESTDLIINGIIYETIAVGAGVGKLMWHIVSETRPNGYSTQKTMNTVEKYSEKAGKCFSEAKALRKKEKELEAEQQALSALPTISSIMDSAPKSSGELWKPIPKDELTYHISEIFGVSLNFISVAAFSAVGTSKLRTSSNIKLFGRTYNGVRSLKAVKIASKPELIRSGRWDSLIEYRDDFGCAVIYIKKGNSYLYFLHDGKKSIAAYYYQLSDDNKSITVAMKAIGMIAIGDETLKREMRSLRFPLGG